MAVPVKKATVVEDGSDTQPVELTPAEQRGLEALRDRINRMVETVGDRSEEMADKLFTGLFQGDVEAGLSPRKAGSQTFRAMQEMCGQSLLLDRVQLSRGVRVGALNAHFRTGGWRRLSWYMKVTLLPLLGITSDLQRLERGIAQASKVTATIASMRLWVAENLPEEERKVGGPAAGVSMAAAAKMLSTGRQLRLASARRLFIDRLQRRGRAAVGAAASDLEATIKNLTLLKEELSEA